MRPARGGLGPTGLVRDNTWWEGPAWAGWAGTGVVAPGLMDQRRWMGTDGSGIGPGPGEFEDGRDRQQLLDKMTHEVSNVRHGQTRIENTEP